MKNNDNILENKIVEEDFMSELRAFLFIIELTLKGEEVSSIDITGKTFIRNSSKVFRIFRLKLVLGEIW